MRQLILVLVLALAVSGVVDTRDAGATHNFGDIADGAFYHAFVQFLLDNAITSGCGGGSYCGEDPVTRGQMAAA